MTKVIVNPGICGFRTEIQVESQDSVNCSIKLNTQCPNISSMDQELQNVNGYQECFSKVGNSHVFEVARRYCKHAACPVPTGIVKGIEVACKLALPKNVEINLE